MTTRYVVILTFANSAQEVLICDLEEALARCRSAILPDLDQWTDEITSLGRDAEPEQLDMAHRIAVVRDLMRTSKTSGEMRQALLVWGKGVGRGADLQVQLLDAQEQPRGEL